MFRNEISPPNPNRCLSLISVWLGDEGEMRNGSRAGALAPMVYGAP